MDAATLIAETIAKLAGLAIEAIAAAQAGDQVALDAIQARAVAASNALAPPGGEPAVAVS